MPEEGFLRRWARVKSTGADAAPEAPRPAPPPAPAPAPAAASPVFPWGRAGDVGPEPGVPAPAPAAQPSAPDGRQAPTLDDVAQLTPDSDYSIFVGQGVDKSVQRQALKKLFADPHFNVLDRLDMYMDDYNKPSPVSAAMLASLDHARSALRRVVQDDAAVAPAEAPAVASAGDAAGRTTLACEAPHGEGSYGERPHREVRHNEAAHNEAPHNEAPHNEALHNEALHNEVAQNEVAQNEAAQAAAAHDAPSTGNAAYPASLTDAGLSDSPNPHMSQG